MANHYLLDDYKTYKNIDLSYTDDDSVLSTLLSGVENHFNSNGIFLQETEQKTKKFSVKNSIVVLPFQNFNFISASINDISLSGDDIIIDGNVIKGNTITFTDGYNAFEMTFTLGFNIIPDNLKLATFIFVDKLYEDIKNNINTISSFNDPVGGREVYNKNIPKTLDLLLNPYKAIIL